MNRPILFNQPNSGGKLERPKRRKEIINNLVKEINEQRTTLGDGTKNA